MRKLFFVLIVSSLYALQTYAQAISVMPEPDSIFWKQGKFRLNASFSAAFPAGDPVIEKAVNRFFRQLNARTRIFFNNEFFLPGTNGSLVINPGKKTEPAPGIDESYHINISAEGISISSPNNIGSLHALETLLQLAEKDEDGYYFPLLTIQDNPAYAWRGLMVDVARHFIPLDVLKRNIDAMAAVKLNVLHLHITDDEGFRMESRVFPKLHQLGSNGNYYTQEELKGLVSYAQDRGIMVVPEFDLPGHSRSWFAGYPELSSTPGTYRPGPRFNMDGKSMGDMMAMINNAPTPTIDPTKESVYQFLDKLMAEVKGIFPYAYFHLGADENNGVAWKQNKAIVAFMEKNKIPDAKALEHYFVMRVHGLTQKHKLRMIVWEEAFNKDLPRDIIVQKWKPEIALLGPVLSAKTVLAQGNDLLISSGFYLDHHMPAHTYHLNSAFTSFKKTDSLKGKLLGGEAAQWSEIVDGNTIETRMWMNAAAVAERLWSAPGKLNIEEMYNRLFRLGHLLDQRGLRHIDQYEKGLRALAGEHAIADVRSLTDVLTPVKGYKRLFSLMGKAPGARHSTAPLNSIADILPLNSEVRWQFRKDVAAYLASPNETTAAAVKKRLEAWSRIGNLGWDDGLAAVKPHAENLSALSAVALEAMDNRSKGEWTEAWAKTKQDLLKKASATYAETDLDIVGELQALITGTLTPVPATYSLL